MVRRKDNLPASQPENGAGAARQAGYGDFRPARLSRVSPGTLVSRPHFPVRHRLRSEDAGTRSSIATPSASASLRRV